MEGASEALQLPVIIERSRPFAREPQLLENLDFFLRSIAAERSILKEGGEARLFFGGLLGLRFQKLKSLGLPWGYSVVEGNFHTKGREIDIPGFKQGIQEGCAVLNREAEDIRFQELKRGDPHLLVALVAELSHQAELAFIFQLLFGNSLDHVQKLLGDQAFEFAERLLLENRAHLFFFFGSALPENQLSNFFE